ncbi:DJ-1/PfpI family protein [Pseudomonadales bacterium]|nr:DJ-1/PfpI family protein [Pseudomonadales bacterium]MDB9756196.1 DJ-1/PfpI family protein [Pseudomonadales bacterium]
MRLGAVFYNDFELLDAYGPLEMFGAMGDEIEIVTIAEQAGPVSSSAGPKTIADYGFNDAPELDLILLPGGIGTIPELGNEAMLTFLKTRAAKSQITMSVCTGSALLAKAGLLDGLAATTNKMFFELARSQSDQVDWQEAARWVDAGRYVTSSGVSAGTDMALAVIQRLFGPEAAQNVVNYTEYQWHTEANTDPFESLLNKGQLPA